MAARHFRVARRFRKPAARGCARDCALARRGGAHRASFSGGIPLVWPHWEGTPVTARETKVLVLGGLSTAKGMDLVAACARDARARGLPLRFRVIGHIAGPSTTRKTRASRSPANTRRARSPPASSRREATRYFFPAQWPETYSYTLTAALGSGLPIVATDLGAFRERLGTLDRARILPWNADAAGSTTRCCSWRRPPPLLPRQLPRLREVRSPIASVTCRESPRGHPTPRNRRSPHRASRRPPTSGCRRPPSPNSSTMACAAAMAGPRPASRAGRQRGPATGRGRSSRSPRRRRSRAGAGSQRRRRRCIGSRARSEEGAQLAAARAAQARSGPGSEHVLAPHRPVARPRPAAALG